MPSPTEPRRSFDGVAEIYHGIRPSYPPPMFDELFRLLPSHPAILEVGPGTGQATRDLLSRGADVCAVEIGPAMAAKLREVLPSPALTVLVGDFEEIRGVKALADEPPLHIGKACDHCVDLAGGGFFLKLFQGQQASHAAKPCYEWMDRLVDR